VNPISNLRSLRANAGSLRFAELQSPLRKVVDLSQRKQKAATL